MLANAVKCFGCDGAGFWRAPTCPRMHDCSRCHGSGQLCADCHKAPGVCECVAGEPCPECGKGACRCE